ncbi:MAG TPA: mechanosensitive ion channel domain-containing protein [Xanthomonadaceae bacterium]|nr:mechanosensitive ion channel domain-containing protein [Xanthomonadaceae bacterium]
MRHSLAGVPGAWTALSVAALIVAAWLASILARKVIARGVARLMRASPMRWDDAIADRGVIHRIAHVVPALLVYAGIAWVPELPGGVATVVRNLAVAYIVLTLALALSALLAAVNDVYLQRPDAGSRPIKGYLQVGKIVVFVFAAVLIVAVLIERSPLLLLSGLGAMTAVLLLVFKDTILSLVASVQLSSNDMVRVGDWIHMPQVGADGDVIDMALHTVKVQNWDKTITTIPTHRLISESFRNWRGMSESGGRRIKRALHIDQGTVRFLALDERDSLKRFSLLRDYIQRKRQELEEWNRQLAEAGQEPVNTRRLTNLGTFRAYVEAYLRHHPRVHQGMTLLVRQLDPGPTGLPLEIYCFTSTTAWGEYEAIQGDIFDHLIAIVPEFHLRLYQQPGGVDLERGLARLASAAGAQG